MAILVFIVATFISCKKEFIEPSDVNKESKTNKHFLSNKLKNPYSLKNMRIAYGNLTKEERSINIEIEASHYYVKFIPKDEAEMDILKQDSTLDLYDFPLNRDSVPEGAYHDPEVPTGQPTYQYCAVKIDYPFPNLEYEILEELYIPEEINRLKGNNSTVDRLVYEALRITDNLKDVKVNNKRGLFSVDRWRPAGSVRVWDENIGFTNGTRKVFSHWEYYDCSGNGTGGGSDLTTARMTCKRAVYIYYTQTIKGSYVPVQGAIVRARRWFRTAKGAVEPDGRFLCDKRFLGDFRYIIYWERYDFVIKSAISEIARYWGPKQKRDWNLRIRDGTQKYYATIFRAAFHYYFDNISGLRRPPENSFWKMKLKIKALDKRDEDNGDFWAARRFLDSHIHIHNPQRNSLSVYSSVIHEMAHASQWNMIRSDYKHADKILKESWARGIAVRLKITH